MHGGRGGGESHRQPYGDGMVFDGRDLFSRHDSRSFGRLSNCCRPAADFRRKYHSLCDSHVADGRSVRDPSFVAEPEIFEDSEDPLDDPRDPDRVLGDRDPDVYGLVLRFAYEIKTSLRQALASKRCWVPLKDA